MNTSREDILKQLDQDIEYSRSRGDFETAFILMEIRDRESKSNEEELTQERTR